MKDKCKEPDKTNRIGEPEKRTEVQLEIPGPDDSPVETMG